MKKGRLVGAHLSGIIGSVKKPYQDSSPNTVNANKPKSPEELVDSAKVNAKNKLIKINMKI